MAGLRVPVVRWRSGNTEGEHAMITAATALPLLGLRITAGPVELRGITDDLLGPLAQLAIDGIHDPDFMPFTFPWSLAETPDMPRNVAQYHWGKRASFSPPRGPPTWRSSTTVSSSAPRDSARRTT